MLVITGATGNIGSKITVKLLNKGEKVRVIGRSSERLKRFVNLGAEAMVGDLADTEFLIKAFKGATAVFAILPLNMTVANVWEYQSRLGESIATAIERAGVKHLVNLSSLGAHLTERAGIVKGLHDQETRLNKLTGTNIIHLRAAYFMENILTTAEMVKTQNVIGSPLNGALRFPSIATKDVADVAADLLTKRNFRGHTVRNLLGQRDVNYNEIVKIVGNTIGNRDLRYVQVPYEEARNQMIKTGVSESVAAALTEMMQTMNEGPFFSEAHRTPDTSTPTSIEEFTRSVSTHFKK